MQQPPDSSGKLVIETGCIFYGGNVTGRGTTAGDHPNQEEAQSNEKTTCGADGLRGCRITTAAGDAAAGEQAAPAVPLVMPSNGIVVMVDAGHGGQDTGAVSADGTWEKDINLAIAIKLREVLKRRGMTVVMTRSDDTFLPITARSALETAKDAQYFVSIHCDYRWGKNTKSGVEVYYHARSVMGHQLAADVLAHMKQSTSPTSAVVLSDMTRFPAGFSVLRRSTVPAVLVECGYMNDAHDLAALHLAEKQQQIAEGIAEGVLEFAARQARTKTSESDSAIRPIRVTVISKE